MDGRPTRIGSVPIIWAGAVDSTNKAASRAIAAQRPPQAHWIIADHQTEGRGRAGRQWASANGNFMGTRLWPVGQNLDGFASAALATGLAVRDAILACAPEVEGVRCKWPNDVYIGQKKVAGILIETQKDVFGAFWAIIGVGVNLISAPGDNAAAMDSSGSVTPVVFVSALEQTLHEALIAWPPTDWSVFSALWEQSAFGLGETVILKDGRTGVFQGIDEMGQAIVGLTGGTQALVLAGDLSFAALEMSA